ncbi:uncharacterized protein K444DRAFT_276750 [Hyaloscypha bicolor E]|uniref:Mcm6 C-terminal winged-helix domain-containing protein n=1 Tax=Hyaloscypha bicolor E TaxID=1095630 RepID=A0A2J6SJ41_9HELO|nr:uncharacterized protein K444DRAFT_276750 [Hyaloscypha bicolor E]PMD50784.1 hypothetical protein K444DRAFT_276750 [Hyaloscypha bicolor E]
MSYENYTAIRRFIVRHIQDQGFAENDGLPGRVLIHLCLERFSPDLQDPEAIRTEKKSIEGAIRRMVEDSMLQPVSRNQKVVFRLDPYFNIKDKNNPSASQPSEDPQSTQEALEALEREASPDIEDQDMDQHIDEELDQQLAQQLDHSMNQVEDQAEEDLDMGERRQDGWVEKVVDNQTERDQVHQVEEVVHNRGDGLKQDQPDDMGNPAETHQESQAAEDADIQAMRQQEAQEAARIEATRHVEAYAEITRGAAPMPQTHIEEEGEDEDPIRTPSRKRRKVLEIAASESSSSFEPISPGKYPNSTPRRRMNRLGTPLSASRRRSAPTGTYNSPSQQRSPRHMEHRIVKEERTDNSPNWLKDAVIELRTKNSESSIITENGLVKCLDCDGKTFKPTANRKIGGVMTHLRSKTHLTNVTRRQEKLGPSECYFPSIPTTIPTIDFNMPQAPLMVFANQRQESPQDLASAFSVLGRALQNDASRKDIRASFVEGRVQEMEKTNKEQQERIDASLAAIERQKVEQQELVSDILASSEQKQQELSREVNDRINSVEEKSKDQLQNIDSRMARFEVESKGRLEQMSTLLARSDQRNINKIEDIAERVNESQESSKERHSQLSGEIRDLKEINEGQNVMIRELDSQVAEKRTCLEKMVEEIHALKSQVVESTEGIRAIREVVNAENEKNSHLSSELAERREEMEAFGKITKVQNEKIHDLEALFEGNTRDLKELMKTVEAQEETHFQQTAKQMEDFKQQTTEQLKNITERQAAMFEKRSAELAAVFERSTTEQLKIIQQQSAWIQMFEKETSSKFRIMESFKKDQEHYKEGLEDVISGIMEDTAQVREFVQELVQDMVRPVATEPSARTVNTRASV